MSARRQPWDRQPGETPKAYAAFVVYRDLGGDRSIAKAAEQVGKSTRLLEGWSRRHSWTIRVQAWDAHEEQAHRQRMRARRIRAEGDSFDAIQELKRRATQVLAKEDLRADLGQVARALDVAVKADLALLEPAAGRHGATVGQVSDEDLEDLTDEEILLRLLDLTDEIEREFTETAAGFGVPREDLRVTLTRETTRSARTT